MERMAEAVPDSNDQALQHFLTNSPWDDQKVVAQVTHDANALLGGYDDSCLIIDESGNPKKGDKSVGVSRQWCGQLGKTDNCQVGVYSVLCHGEHVAPIGYRLFLPQCWIDDEERCKLAVQLVIEARGQGAGFQWVGADASGVGMEKNPMSILLYWDCYTGAILGSGRANQLTLND
jgi:SRSO17 transposase